MGIDFQIAADGDYEALQVYDMGDLGQIIEQANEITGDVRQLALSDTQGAALAKLLIERYGKNTEQSVLTI
ncbi:MAG: hypothetical protein P0Y56_12190 [Candidatus Andeanibacterium colombiense]|uniref:Uncharacterized protein n=1 Tax=Candidatus Andeanibacterium colombiense TaxID=3121345 RepID=A0AAJ5X823_9SPHN|nr:MAG: hypothetical protein P0Y56_12190 [Sphingomonadaceae bacterium]